MNVKDKVTKARCDLLIDHPFWAVLALKLIVEPNKNIETAGVNATHLYFNPDWIEKMPAKKLVGLLAHETAHVAFGHIWRLENRDRMIFNMACDYAVNSILLKDGFELPDGGLYKPEFEDKSAEEIYSILIQQKEKQEQKNKSEKGKGTGQSGNDSSSGSDSDDGENENEKDENNKSDKSKNGKDGGDSDGNENESENENGKDGADGNGKSKSSKNPAFKNKIGDVGGCGEMLDSDGDSEKKKELAEDWKITLSQAVQLSKGNIPASMKRLVKEIIDPPLPWFVILRDFVESAARNDYNWSVPNPKYLQNGIVLPSLISDELTNVVIAIDTSGSISDEILSKFANEVSTVLSTYDCAITLIYCDAAIQKIVEYTKADLPLKLEAIGGGGTDFRPVFEHIEKSGLDTKCLIYLTDLYGDFPKTIPDFPTLWVAINTENKAPFGLTIPLK